MNTQIHVIHPLKKIMAHCLNRQLFAFPDQTGKVGEVMFSLENRNLGRFNLTLLALFLIYYTVWIIGLPFVDENYRSLETSQLENNKINHLKISFQFLLNPS